MKLLLFTILFMIIAWYLLPTIWQSSGGTFIHGNSVIYKGKILFDSKPGCAIATNRDFSKIKRICDGKVEILINGEQVAGE